MDVATRSRIQARRNQPQRPRRSRGRTADRVRRRPGATRVGRRALDDALELYEGLNEHRHSGAWAATRWRRPCAVLTLTALGSLADRVPGRVRCAPRGRGRRDGPTRRMPLPVFAPARAQARRTPAHLISAHRRPPVRLDRRPSSLGTRGHGDGRSSPTGSPIDAGHIAARSLAAGIAIAWPKTCPRGRRSLGRTPATSPFWAMGEDYELLATVSAPSRVAEVGLPVDRTLRRGLRCRDHSKRSTPSSCPASSCPASSTSASRRSRARRLR